MKMMLKSLNRMVHCKVDYNRNSKHLHIGHQSCTMVEGHSCYIVAARTFDVKHTGKVVAEDVVADAGFDDEGAVGNDSLVVLVVFATEDVADVARCMGGVTDA